MAPSPEILVCNGDLKRCAWCHILRAPFNYLGRSTFPYNPGRRFSYLQNLFEGGDLTMITLISIYTLASAVPYFPDGSSTVLTRHARGAGCACRTCCCWHQRCCCESGGSSRKRCSSSNVHRGMYRSVLCRAIPIHYLVIYLRHFVAFRPTVNGIAPIIRSIVSSTFAPILVSTRTAAVW